MTAPRVRVQVVDEIAAPHDKYPFLAQRCEPFAGFVVEFCRSRLVDAELYDWNVCFGKDVSEHRPGAVVEAPVLVEPAWIGARRP